MSKPELQPSQQKFVQEYLLDLNGSQAALRAGYSKKTAASQSTRLLQNAKVQKAIQIGMKKLGDRTDIKQENVLLEISRLAFSNMMDYIRVQPDGSAFVDLSELTREKAAAIQEITVDEYTDGRGDTARNVKRTKIKLADKERALELAGKHLGMWLTGALGSAANPLVLRPVSALTNEELDALILNRLAIEDGSRLECEGPQ